MLSNNFKAQMSEMKLIFDKIKFDFDEASQDEGYVYAEEYQNLLERIFLIIQNESKIDEIEKDFGTMIDLRELEIGDEVQFKCGGKAIVSFISETPENKFDITFGNTNRSNMYDYNGTTYDYAILSIVKINKKSNEIKVGKMNMTPEQIESFKKSISESKIEIGELSPKYMSAEEARKKMKTWTIERILMLIEDAVLKACTSISFPMALNCKLTDDELNHIKSIGYDIYFYPPNNKFIKTIRWAPEINHFVVVCDENGYEEKKEIT